MNNSINLLGNKNHVSAPPASRKLKLLRAIAVLLLFGVSAAAVSLSILIAFSPLPQVQQQEQESRQKISQYHPEMTKIALIQDRHYIDEEIAIGDFVLTGGELPSMLIADAVVRLIPGALSRITFVILACPG